MDMKTWAEKEVELACIRERGGKEDDGEWDYGCACYQSALKAYNSLIEDDHSGYSWGITASILKELMAGRPLTPIEDTEDIWNLAFEDDGIKSYQCTRMSSLFKDVYPDGTVTYHDVDSCICVDIHNPVITYTSSLVRKRIVEEMFPITMPYCPGESIKIYCEDFLFDVKNGDYDTVGVLYAKKPDGEKIEINRFFKESKDGWDEIDYDEYMDRHVNQPDRDPVEAEDKEEA